MLLCIIEKERERLNIAVEKAGGDLTNADVLEINRKLDTLIALYLKTTLDEKNEKNDEC